MPQICMNVCSTCKYLILIYSISSIASLIYLHTIRTLSFGNFKFPAFFSSSLTFQLDTQIGWDFNFINSPWLRAEASLGTTLIMRYWKGCRIFILKHARKGFWKQLKCRIYDLIWFYKLNNCHGLSLQYFLKISGSRNTRTFFVTGPPCFPDHVEMVLEWLQSGGHRSFDTDLTCWG